MLGKRLIMGSQLVLLRPLQYEALDGGNFDEEEALVQNYYKAGSLSRKGYRSNRSRLRREGKRKSDPTLSESPCHGIYKIL